MNKHMTKFILVGAAVVAVLAFVSAHDESKSTSAATKHQTLHKGHHPYGLANKGGGQLEIAIASNVVTPIPAGRKFVLTASVVTKAALQDLRYEWLLPEGVVAAPGTPLTGSLGDIAEGGTVETQIQLQTSSDDNALVHLHVYRMVEWEAHGQVAQFNTRDQAKIAAEMSQKVEALGMTKDRGPASSSEPKRIYQ